MFAGAVSFHLAGLHAGRGNPSFCTADQPAILGWNDIASVAQLREPRLESWAYAG